MFVQINCCRHPKNPSEELRIPLTPNKNVATELFIKVVVGPKLSPICHVFEVVQKLPTFAAFIPSNIREEPQSYVTFVIPDRINRVWEILMAVSDCEGPHVVEPKFHC